MADSTGKENVIEIRMIYKRMLMLKHPATMQGRVLSCMLNMSREIPLDIFDVDPYSAIAQDLRTYAPHLFNDDPPRRVRADIDADDAWL